MKRIIFTLSLLFFFYLLEVSYVKYSFYEYKIKVSYIVEKMKKFKKEHNKLPNDLTEILSGKSFGDHPTWVCTNNYFEELPGLGYCGYNKLSHTGEYEIYVGSHYGWQTYSSKVDTIKLVPDIEYKPTYLWYIIKYIFLFYIIFIFITFTNILKIFGTNKRRYR